MSKPQQIVAFLIFPSTSATLPAYGPAEIRTLEPSDKFSSARFSCWVKRCPSVPYITEKTSSPRLCSAGMLGVYAHSSPETANWSSSASSLATSSSGQKCAELTLRRELSAAGKQSQRLTLGCVALDPLRCQRAGRRPCHRGMSRVPTLSHSAAGSRADLRGGHRGPGHP